MLMTAFSSKYPVRVLESVWAVSVSEAYLPGLTRVLEDVVLITIPTLLFQTLVPQGAGLG